MTRAWRIGGAALAALLIVVLAAVFVIQPRIAARQDAAALADLPRRLLAPMLMVDEGPPDLVVFRDGDAGWFELDLAALPDAAEIGFHGPRLFDVMTGNDHLPLYCTSQSGARGKIIWAVADHQIARDYAFCNPRRMDLSDLRAHGEAVDLVTQHVARMDLDPFASAIIANPTQALVSLPQASGSMTHRRVLTLPPVWFAPDSRFTRFDVQYNVEQALMRAMNGEGVVRVHSQSDVQMVMTFYNPTEVGGEVQVSGMAIQHDDGVILLPGFWADAFEVHVDCMPEVCARLDAVDLAEALAPGRDMAALDAALAQALAAPGNVREDTANPAPTMDDLRDPTVNLTDTSPITYEVRYIQRP